MKNNKRLFNHPDLSNKVAKCSREEDSAHSRAMKPLRAKNLVTDDIRQAITGHTKCSSLSAAYVTLINYGMFNNHHLEPINGHPDPRRVKMGIDILQNNRLLTAQNINIITAHNRPDLIAECAVLLNKHGLYTEANIQTVINHPESRAVTSSILYLNNYRILDAMTRDVINKHPYIDPKTLVRNLIELDWINELTLDNLETLTNALDPIKTAQNIQNQHRVNHSFWINTPDPEPSSGRGLNRVESVDDGLSDHLENLCRLSSDAPNNCSRG